MSSQKIKRQQAQNQILAPIPDKLYFTIGEVAELCHLRPHVLRYWEQEFPQLAPIKRRGNRRYYQRKDILLVRQIKELLYERGYTIDGARQELTGTKVKVSDEQKRHERINKILSEIDEALHILEIA